MKGNRKLIQLNRSEGENEKKWQWLVVFALCNAGLSFGALVAAGARDPLVITAAVIAAVSGSVISHLHPLPKVKLSDEKREAKQDVTDANAAVEQVAKDENES